MQHSKGDDVHILALAGSFRKGSLNQALIRAARELAPEHVRIGDLDLSTLPFYDGDLEAAGDPGKVTALKSAIAGADALLVATPEYNGSVPAVLKNAIDWASRRRPDSPLKGKPAAVVGASPSPGGTRRAQAHLREVLGSVGADIVDETFPLPGPRLRACLRRTAGIRKRQGGGARDHRRVGRCRRFRRR